MLVRQALRCPICVFPVFWDVRALCCDAPRAPQWSPHTWNLPSGWFVCSSLCDSPSAAGEQTGCQSGAHLSASCALCSVSLPWGAAQRRMETHLAGLVLHGQLWTRRASPPAAVGELGPELQHVHHRPPDSCISTSLRFAARCFHGSLWRVRGCKD